MGDTESRRAGGAVAPAGTAEPPTGPSDEERARRYEAICEATTDFVGITDVDGAFLYLNPAAREMLGIGHDEDVTELPSGAFFDVDHYAQVSDSILESLIATGSWSGELILRSRNGRTFPVSQVTTVHLEEDGSPAFFSSISRDISAMKHIEATLEHQATHDRLTNIPNHALFVEFVAHAIARNERNGLATAVAFIDLDRFKSINDTFGHVGGDEVLMEVAHRLRTHLRPGDTVGRFGGDEFTVLIEDLPSTEAGPQAREVVDRILAALRVPVPLGDRIAPVTASAGLAIAVPGDGTSAAELIRHADLAMYRAKSGGKDRAEQFDADLRRETEAAIAVAAGLERALDEEQFVVEFQPIVDTDSRECIAAEALVRWRIADGTLLPPAEFIPVAEERGLLGAIGERVLVEAAQWAVQWRDLVPSFVIGVNVSASQLLAPSFLHVIRRTLDITGLAPDALSIEITEEGVLHDVARAVQVLEELGRMGVWVAIDDFGTGYSSLSYLRELPVSTVKVDRAFVRGIVDSARDRAVLRSIIDVAAALDLWCVAEGVETEAEREVLIELGAPVAQGFLYARPMSGPALGEYITAARTPVRR